MKPLSHRLAAKTSTWGLRSEQKEILLGLTVNKKIGVVLVGGFPVSLYHIILIIVFSSIKNYKKSIRIWC